MNNKRILLVDDHQILVDGMKNLIPADSYEIAGGVTNAEEALRMINTSHIDIMITDIMMPGMSGIELIREVKRVSPQTRIIILSMSDDKSTVLECIQLGVNAYITKNINRNDLLRALDHINQNKFYLSHELASILVDKVNENDQAPMLTPRETEILSLVVDELSNKQIAERLFISERTVESHRKNIYRKTGQETLVGLIKFAIDNRLI